MKRRLKVIAIFLLLGLLVSVGDALLCAAVVDVDKGTQEGMQRGEWSANVTSTPGATRIQTRRAPASWSPEQATGAPDTPLAGDYTSAWASKSHDGSTEWLQVEFDRDYVPAFIDIYESYNPGGLTRVTSVDDAGKETELWSGEDPTKHGSGMGTSRIAVTMPGGKGTRRVRLYVGRPGFAEWNEIDAVGLIDAAGATHWAVDATASSWYGGPAPSPVPVQTESIIPAWSGLLPGMAEGSRRKSNWEERTVDARGWPMVALFSRTEAVEHAQLSKSQYLSSPFSGSLTGYNAPRRIVWPWRPIWGGLFVDSALFGMILFLLWTVATGPRRFFREVSRMKRGCCVACGYDLGYDFLKGCPECGWRRAEAAQRRE